MRFGHETNDRLLELQMADTYPSQTGGTDNDVRAVVEHEFLLMEQEHARIRAAALTSQRAGRNNPKNFAGGRFK